MNEIVENKEIQFDFEPAVHFEDHREKDRREKACEGYCYISTVGWICRRERFRRKDLAGSSGSALT